MREERIDTHLRELLSDTPDHEQSARNLHRSRHNRAPDPSQCRMYDLQQGEGLHKHSSGTNASECRLSAAVDGLQNSREICFD